MCHSLRIDCDDHRRTMSAAYHQRSLKIAREVDVLTAHFLDPFLLDSRKEPRRCSVIQITGRLHRSQLYVYL